MKVVKGVFAAIGAGCLFLGGLALGRSAAKPTPAKPPVEAGSILEIVPPEDGLERARMPCVPLETISKGVGRVEERSSILGHPDAITGHPEAKIPFPLNLGQVMVPSMPDGGRIQIDLVDRGDNTGRLQATVVEVEQRKWRWLDQASVGLGAGETLDGQRMVAADLRVEVVRREKLALEAKLDWRHDSMRGSDVAASAWLRYSFR